MFAEWYRPGVQLDYPKGGSEGIIHALVRGVLKLVTARVRVRPACTSSIRSTGVSTSTLVLGTGVGTSTLGTFVIFW